MFYIYDIQKCHNMNEKHFTKVNFCFGTTFF